MKLISIRAIGENVHTSVKNYYFGVIGGIVTLLANCYLDPSFFKVWEIGSSSYCMDLSQFVIYLIVAFFGWAS